jgi:hypothetical protein
MTLNLTIVNSWETGRREDLEKRRPRVKTTGLAGTRAFSVVMPMNAEFHSRARRKNVRLTETAD